MARGSSLALSTALRKVPQGQSGQAIAIVAVFMMALVGMTALLLDLSRSALVANEIQTAADIAATSAIKAQMGRVRSEPRQAALATLAANKADTRALAEENLKTLELGNFDGTNFYSNVAPFNAAKATTTTTVNNLLMAAFGFPTTVITKEATALGSFVSAAIPTLPIVIGDCNFKADCFEDSCMPRLSSAPDQKTNTAFTSFFDTDTSTDRILSFLPSGCADNAGRSIGVKVSDYINLGNGAAKPVLSAIQSCVANGHTEFLIPIVPCSGNFRQSKSVTGFATIIVDSVRVVGNPSGISLHAIFADAPGVRGGGSVNGGMATFNLIQ